MPQWIDFLIQGQVYFLALGILVLGTVTLLLLDACLQKKSAMPVYWVTGIVLASVAGILGSQAHQVFQPVSGYGLQISSLSITGFFWVTMTALLTWLGTLALSKRNLGMSWDLMCHGLCASLLLSLLGMALMMASSHWMLTFISLELMSLPLYVMVALPRRDVRAHEAGLKYFLLGSAASATLLFGAALSFALTGSLEWGVDFTVNHMDRLWAPHIAIALILAGFLFKLAMPPFHFWLADVYEGALSPVTGFMAAAVKLTILVTLTRWLMTLSGPFGELVMPVLWWLAVLGLAVGHLAALAQANLKRMLAYSSMVQAGYFILMITVAWPSGNLGTVLVPVLFFYWLVYAMSFLGAMTLLTIMHSDGLDCHSLKDLEGLGFKRPFLAVSLTICLLSLVGLPPLAGFMAKAQLLRLVVDQQQWITMTLIIAGSLLASVYYARPIFMMYFKPGERRVPTWPLSWPLMLGLFICVGFLFIAGLMPGLYQNLFYQISK
jgi:NADH-quinone oxidoreductase subunit N